MKRFLFVTLMSIVLAGTTDAKHFHKAFGSFGFFYTSLSSYGEWIDCDYGYVWRPLHVTHGWKPYMHGRWAWTDYGWYWVSHEPFGWATFHYGRWQYDDYYGWIWIPDNVWGPAWVEWRYDDDYIGWAPLPPHAMFSISLGITFTDHWIAPIHYWNFISCHNFTSTRVADYVQPVERSRRIFGNTRSIRDIRAERDRVINRGVDIDLIERRTNVRINKMDVIPGRRASGDRIVQEANRERIEAFRPRLEGSTRGEVNRPSEVRRAERPINIEGRSPADISRKEEQSTQTFERRENTLNRPHETRQRSDEIRQQRQYERKTEAPRVIEQQRPREQRREYQERRYDLQRERNQEMRQERTQNQRPQEYRQRESQTREAPRTERRAEPSRERPQQEQRSDERRPRR